MNKISRLSVKDVSLGIAQLMPNIIRGVQIDFFANRAITQTQFLMIVAVHAYGRCRMSTLAKNMKIKMPTATGIADRLEKAGYVHRFSEPHDRRVVMLELTSNGKGFIAEFKNVMRRRWEEVLGILNKEELNAFHQAITKLKDDLQKPS